jgi:peptidoglycan hydrolase-like protein with peptidoglycan-binding domain
MSNNRSFHCCATCQHYLVKKGSTGITYFCTRLSYDTKPTYQFNCWQPKEKVISLMKKRNSISEDKNDST